MSEGGGGQAPCLAKCQGFEPCMDDPMRAYCIPRNILKTYIYLRRGVSDADSSFELSHSCCDLIHIGKRTGYHWGFIGPNIQGNIRDEETLSKILDFYYIKLTMFNTGGDDETTAATTNEGGEQRGEDRHQHLRLQHRHAQVMLDDTMEVL